MNARFAMAALVLTAACSRREPETAATATTSGPAVTTETSGATTTGRPPGPTMAHEDVSFMKKAAQSGMLEVELGGQAVEKASTPEVKAFGTRMVVDHGKANQELKGIAASKNITLPSDLNDDAKKDVERLSRLSGDAFERAYAALMVEEHEKDVKDFRAAARYVKDADVRAWAGKTAPILEDHLRHAREVKSELEPTVGAR